jgi:hypothetical protein
MLVAKLRGEAYVTEVALPQQAEPVAPAPPVIDLSKAIVALVTEGGLVPEDNPDRIESSSAALGDYPLAMLERNTGPPSTPSMRYDSQWVDADPDHVVAARCAAGTRRRSHRRSPRVASRHHRARNHGRPRRADGRGDRQAAHADGAGGHRHQHVRDRSALRGQRLPR